MNSVMEQLKNDAILCPIEKSIENVVSNVFGADKWTQLDKWYSLLSFPSSDKVWNVPHNSWHADEPIIEGEYRPLNLFVFIFLEKVTIESGPTVVVKGSHLCGEKLAHRLATDNKALNKAFEIENKKLLSPTDIYPSLKSEHPWFNDLAIVGEAENRIKKFLNDGAIYQDIPVKVVPLTASPGDIIILDPRCLHSYSSNISMLPRQILRLDFKRGPFAPCI